MKQSADSKPCNPPIQTTIHTRIGRISVANPINRPPNDRGMTTRKGPYSCFTSIRKQTREIVWILPSQNTRQRFNRLIAITQVETQITSASWLGWQLWEPTFTLSWLMSERVLADGLRRISARRLREVSLLVLGEELRRRLLLNFLPRPLIILRIQPD